MNYREVALHAVLASKDNAFTFIPSCKYADIAVFKEVTKAHAISHMSTESYDEMI